MTVYAFLRSLMIKYLAPGPVFPTWPTVFQFRHLPAAPQPSWSFDSGVCSPPDGWSKSAKVTFVDEMDWGPEPSFGRRRQIARHLTTTGGDVSRLGLTGTGPKAKPPSTGRSVSAQRYEWRNPVAGRRYTSPLQPAETQTTPEPQTRNQPYVRRFPKLGVETTPAAQKPDARRAEFEADFFIF